MGNTWCCAPPGSSRGSRACFSPTCDQGASTPLAVVQTGHRDVKKNLLCDYRPSATDSTHWKDIREHCGEGRLQCDGILLSACPAPS
jgi:hypothetical protein